MRAAELMPEWKIVENHDGHVGAENVPAGGASFWFELPVSA